MFGYNSPYFGSYKNDHKDLYDLINSLANKISTTDYTNLIDTALQKNKSYTNSISSSFKVNDKKIVVVSGNVKIDNKVSSVVKIDEDTTGAILNSKLSNVAVSKKKNLYNNLRARYEKNE